MWECGTRCLGGYIFVSVGGEALGCALRIGVAKICAVDVMFTSVLLGMVCLEELKI
jgi:hypothetical protein